MSEQLLRCTCYRLRRAARIVTQGYDAALAGAGLTATQFALLAELSRAEAVPVSVLARKLGTDRTTMTRTLRPLLREKLVAPEKTSDRRVHAVSMTPQGFARYGAAARLWRETEAEMARGLGAGRLEELYGLLENVEGVMLSARRSEDQAPAVRAAPRA
ncbi:MAG: MarR family transcriptional regulator [Rhodobiaceae bacterium]|nr:MarR family transcriptional regulator [Rhodobiaceae bacterium]MCC0054791.1 MarR family transcriptional regulator [Rhodobiaceae bacterium]